MEFLTANELSILRWIHILAMVYWLGGEWGVFQTSYHVTNRNLSLEERKRHMETAYRIDILARTGIVLLLPLGLHMGKLYGFIPMLEGAGIWWMWLFFAIWLAMTWTAFIKRETDIGIKVTRTEELLRYPLIVALFVFAFMALGGSGPIETAEGNHWYPWKMILYAFALIIGLFLRLVMRRWTERFRILAQGPDAAQEAALEREITQARISAYIYWITIATVCFLGAVKPF
ncbi:hypothetical protein P7228_10050 [Altererythrobacter arenosus]|uniref:DUF2269 family protein n=1 Tax=Altererythrobacter arenosus TaxID=3032592 RepID=A0ABY8FWD2_9SPHN|nr:hypothetical protein [Altererythrobacter sp. CAU 1644]WFL76339.1 hypothetical protein P7228_10050 [Altererythrobacter sp. CAU 1644]